MFYGTVVNAKDVTYVEASSESPIQVTRACLQKPADKPDARVVVEIFVDESASRDGEEEASAKRAVLGVLSSSEHGVENLSLDLVLNSRTGLRLVGPDATGAVVHLVGMKLETFESDEEDGFGDEADEDEDDDDLPRQYHRSRTGGNGAYDSDEIDEGDLLNDCFNGNNEGGEDIIDDASVLALLRDADNKKEAGFFDNSDDDADDDDDGDDDDDDGDDDGDRYMLAEHAKQFGNEAEERDNDEECSSSDSDVHGTNVEEKKRRAGKSKEMVPNPRKLRTVTHKSGLQYQDLLIGSGRFPRKGKYVAIQYTARLESGKIVDRSKEKLLKFRLGTREVIRGIDIGVVGMREGGERQLVLPPDLAYGSEGAPPHIPPNATLCFDMKLVRIWQ